jgi:hypothetical protein
MLGMELKAMKNAGSIISLAAGDTAVIKPPKWAPPTCSLMTDLTARAAIQLACSTSCEALASKPAPRKTKKRWAIYGPTITRGTRTVFWAILPTTGNATSIDSHFPNVDHLGPAASGLTSMFDRSVLFDENPSNRGYQIIALLRYFYQSGGLTS